MGWTPAEVRACSLADFVAALDGWLAAREAAEDPSPLEDPELLAMVESE